MNDTSIGQMYMQVWQSRIPCPVAEPDVDLAYSYKEIITSDYINELPLHSYDGPIHIVRTEDELDEAICELERETVVGFDTETRPIFKKGTISPVALVQLASANAVWLVQLANVPFGERLAELLANPEIVKAGVAISDDMLALARIYPFAAHALADLGRMAQDIGIKTIGLRSLTANLLGFRISKNAQCSNWERDKLEPRQIRYAATDAWLGRELYLRLIELGSKQVVDHLYKRS